ncbi:DNA cytosine methyltransferase (plasmid) [Chromobacterium amazonense]|uniref:DNA cytosine methyltransferase n=1 Tax=Chromobacterium amazonense TaxID=1382803 RepID=UPI00237E4A61|nr:DNA cytosine methyltransferase [Chromobacterium amazonense]MDE1713587.1 DNA cytosine methyltransferase [Chromobacterium amazonense]
MEYSSNCVKEPQCEAYAAPSYASPSNQQRKRKRKPAFLEFFAGSGLVSHALAPYFDTAWANDISAKKAKVYAANHSPGKFELRSITEVYGGLLPHADLSWASFPCQDLSLAGLNGGIHAERSGLVWEWLRILDESTNQIPLLVAENVVGLVSANGGDYYRTLHASLRERGYRVGALMLDAARWVPQSRPRIFVVALHKDHLVPPELMTEGPTWAHSPAIVKVAEGLEDWVWWKLPEPAHRKQDLADIIEWDAPCDPPEVAARNIALIPENHRRLLDSFETFAAPGYKRTRARGQTLELRFDGVAGCLRTPKGGSSRQFLVLKRDGKLSTRLLTVRETARLMGAPDTFQLPGSYNDGYMAMGDAVAAPVAAHLAKHLLAPLYKSTI